MSKIIEFDCITKIQTERDKTDAEIAQDALDLEKSKAEAATDLATATQAATDKASGNAKLKALGLTDAEIAALVG